jgi:hypothetical protein
MMVFATGFCLIQRVGKRVYIFSSICSDRQGRMEILTSKMEFAGYSHEAEWGLQKR